MRSISKLGLVALAALLVCAAVASSASATVSVRTGSDAGSLVANGTAVTGTSTGNTVLTGTFFGLGVTVTCAPSGSTPSSSVSGNVTVNSGTAALGKITAVSFNNCTSSVGGTCTVQSYSNSSTNTLVSSTNPWDPTANSGGLAATAYTHATGKGDVWVSPGSNGSVRLSGTNCMPFSSTCNMTGAGGTNGGLVNTAGQVSDWTNPGTGDQLDFNTSGSPAGVAVQAGPGGCTATGGRWSAKYTLKTSGGALVYLGN